MLDTSLDNKLDNYLREQITEGDYAEVITPNQKARLIAALGFLRNYNELENEFERESQKPAADKAREALTKEVTTIKEALGVKAQELDEALALAEKGTKKINDLTKKKLLPAVNDLIATLGEMRKIEAAHRTPNKSSVSMPDFRVVASIEKLQNLQAQELI